MAGSDGPADDVKALGEFDLRHDHCLAEEARLCGPELDAALDEEARCGDVARGFVRRHCAACGHDMLVAFSCKARGLCPSCETRRMCNEAACLVDRVVPNVPLRQWVLSLPFELRRLPLSTC